MTRFAQIHFLTSYPPANLNRDDMGSPKTARMGGYDRLRVSSQCLKRTWRTSELFEEAVKEHIGTRTKEMGIKIYNLLTSKKVRHKDALEWAKKYKKLIGFFRINPNEKGFEDEIKRSVENGLKGMKLHPRSQNFSLKSKNVKKCLRLAKIYEIPVIIHCGRTVDLGAFEKLAEEFSDLDLIMGHAGMNRSSEATKIAEKYKNVFLEISINTQDSVRFILKHTDINQILFGSDTPYGDPEVTLKRIDNINLKKSERKYILYENARKLLKR